MSAAETPFSDARDGCPDPVGDATPLSTVFDRAAATSEECIDTVVPEIRAQIAGVFAAIREQAPHAAIGTLAAYDTWIGWSELDSADSVTRDRLYEAERYWMHQWRDAMCAEAEAVGAVCVDAYSVFNGADGRQPPTNDVAGDYTHPSRAGNDAIRDLLVQADLLQGH